MNWKENNISFENAPAGSHIARAYALIDLGSQTHTWNGEAKISRDVRISFELPMEKMEGIYHPESKGKPFSVHLTVKQSLHPQARLRKYLEGWRGRKFTKEELAGFDPHKLVGTPCRLTLVENGDYVNVDSISPLGKNEKCPKQINKSVFLSLEAEEFDRSVFDSLHERTREKISKSPEFKALVNGTGEEPQGDPSEHGDEPPLDDNAPF